MNKENIVRALFVCMVLFPHFASARDVLYNDDFILQRAFRALLIAENEKGEALGESNSEIVTALLSNKPDLFPLDRINSNGELIDSHGIPFAFLRSEEGFLLVGMWDETMLKFERYRIYTPKKVSVPNIDFDALIEEKDSETGSIVN